GPGRVRPAPGRGPVAEHDRGQRRQPPAAVAVDPPGSQRPHRRAAVAGHVPRADLRAGPRRRTPSVLRLIAPSSNGAVASRRRILLVLAPPGTRGPWPACVETEAHHVRISPPPHPPGLRDRRG